MTKSAEQEQLGFCLYDLNLNLG